MFQFAETVEEGAWSDEQRKKDIEVRGQVPLASRLSSPTAALLVFQARISSLARENQQKNGSSN